MITRRQNLPLPAAANPLRRTTFLWRSVFVALCLGRCLSATNVAQTPQRTYPSEIRGYKVAQARVIIQPTADYTPNASGSPESSSQNATNNGASPSQGAAKQDTSDAMVTLGTPRVVKITPLGLTLEVPLTVAPLRQGGKVDFIAFEDITVNDGSVELPEYTQSFKLPDKKPLTLAEPLRVFISAPHAVAVLAGDWWEQKPVWRVTGRAYVFGSFKKFLFNFKRVVPVEFDLMIDNPLRKPSSRSVKVFNPRRAA